MGAEAKREGAVKAKAKEKEAAEKKLGREL